MPDNFNEYRRHILNELVRLSNNLDKLQGIAASLAVEIGELKATNAVKAGLWGSIGGTFGGILFATILKEVF